MNFSSISLQSIEEKWVRHAKLLAPEDFLILAEYFFHQDRAFLLSHKADFVVSRWHAWKFEKLLRKRVCGIPVAYITGHKEFSGFDFLVTHDTLIPRPETETLVEDVLETYRGEEHKTPLTVIDVGTGSGCIALALRKKIPEASVHFFASDVSRKALRVAKKNARRLQIKVRYSHGSLLAPWKQTLREAGNVYITANLPYVSQKLYQTVSKEVQTEPQSALISSDQGLAHYYALLREVQMFRQKNITLWLEISPEQSQLLSEHVQKVFPQATVQIFKDLSGRDRFIKVTLTPNPSTHSG